MGGRSPRSDFTKNKDSNLGPGTYSANHDFLTQKKTTP